MKNKEASGTVTGNPVSERTILVGLDWKTRSSAPRGSSASADAADESMDELAELAVSAGARIVCKVIQSRSAPEAATLIGKGKVTELADAVRTRDVDAVIFDRDLSPTQQRNLEKTLNCKVIDRTQLILDIFASRARTREGRLQVELAQLNYLLPRLAGHGVEMSRLGGGIGTRGPGETKLETDRRRISRRIKKLEDDLENVRSGRALHRKKRSAVPLATLALAGYTNAGKSTLFNRLTESAVLVDARMFATLDPTVRPVTLPSRRRVLASDTVGFIRNLPTTLVKAFRATLEEVAEASIILHVVDISSPSADEHVEHVAKVLAEIGASEIPQILVLNKVDRLGDDADAAARRIVAAAGGAAKTHCVSISAQTGAGMDGMLRAIDEALPLDPVVRQKLRIAAGDGATLALLHAHGRVLESRYSGDWCHVVAEIPESLKLRLTAARVHEK